MPATSGGKLFQNSVYVGISLENILYGIQLMLYLKTMRRLLDRPGELKKSNVFYAIFSTATLSMSTVWVFIWGMFCGKMWLQDTNFPGNADAFWVENISAWYIILVTAIAVVLQLMTDGLMIFRCWAIWNSYRIIVVPLILWTGSLVLGIFVCWTSNAKGGLFFRNIAIQVGVAYFSVSVFLTAVLTWLICLRLLRHGRLIKEHLDPEYASPYFTTATLVIESVLPYTLSGIMFLVSLGLGSQMMSLFGYIHVLMMCVSPQMLILRVTMRTAWRTKLHNHLTVQEDTRPERIVKGRSSKCDSDV